MGKMISSIVNMKNGFDFKILKTSAKSKARRGILKTPYGDVQTPAFVTVGTKGTVKSLTPQNLEHVGTQMVFVNTYHMVVSGALSVVAKTGIHQFSGIQKPIITDSGGFQMFSLARQSPHIIQGEGGSSEQPPHLVKITDDGVEFRSPINGDLFYFTPEFSIDAQRRIGSDFAVAFDECVPYGSSDEYTKNAMTRTHRWAERSLQQFNNQTKKKLQQLFGVIQGGCFEDLRKTSAAFISSLPFFGLAIGGVSVGETKKEMREQMQWVMDGIQRDSRPRHLLGIGEFDDIVDAVAMGIDTMDCVIPTRHGRMGKLYSLKKSKVKNKNDSILVENILEIDIIKSQHKSDLSAIDTDCMCYTCHHFTKAYIHHLFKQRELLGYHLATIHNLHFVEQFFSRIRSAIEEDCL